MQNPKGLRWKKIGLLLVSTLSSLVLVELFLRIFAPVYPTANLHAFQYDAELGTQLRPGIHLFKTTDFQEEIKVNNLGTANFQEDFDGYEALVFAAGDSYTEGTGLPADMSYPAQLDLLLNQDGRASYAKKYGVLNLGVAGYGGEQSVLAIRRLGSLVGKPAVILYLGCDNDYEDDLLFNGGHRHKHIVAGNPYWGWLVTPMQWLTNDLQIGFRLKLIASDMRRSSLIKPANEAEKIERPPSVAELEKAPLDKLLAFSKESAARLVVSWEADGDSYRWLKQWASDNKVSFADWSPRVESVKASIPSLPSENQHSGGHHRGWVNRIIAEEYGKIILNQGKEN